MSIAKHFKILPTLTTHSILRLTTTLSIFFFLTTIDLIAQNSTTRTESVFDFGWKFHRGGVQRAEVPDFDDAEWRAVDLPHDWSIENIPGTSSPFDPKAVGQVSSGFTVGGTGWYRKTFTIPADQKGRRFYMRFDGVYMNADVWVNGVAMGDHPYGYTSFYYDITEQLKPSGKNVVAVQVKNEGANSRWYSGSGIYRHVWLTSVNPIHVSTWGTYITTSEVTAKSAKVNIKTSIRNASPNSTRVKIVSRIFDADRKQVGQVESESVIDTATSSQIEQNVVITDPRIWSLESPHLYNLFTEIVANNSTVDSYQSTFGIRTISFDAQKGFQLNGQSVELKGGCVHHDNGPLGARAYDRAEERRVELLKASGYNAIRCAHNPPSPKFLETCDRLGMLVIDEAFDMWINPNNPYDYHLYFNKWWQRDIESMVFRDRNHPSIIMWSIGNEIKGMDTPEVVKVANMLAGHIRSIEPTRPVTAAVNSVTEKKDPYFAALDIGGYNYARNKYVNDHERHPDRVMFCSESFPMEAFEYWTDAKQYPWVVGDFVWTAFDYIGESSIGWRGYMQEANFYPWTLAYCGDIDICGWKRPQSYYRDVLWNDKNTVSIFVKPPKPSFPENPKRESWSLWHWHDAVADWNWAGFENTPLQVDVYSSCEVVELFLNGKSLGKKATNASSKFIASWNVPYAAGSLTAVGFKGKKKVTTSTLKTAEQPSALRLTADRSTLKPDGQSLSYITVEIVDNQGTIDPKAENLLTFAASGAAEIIAVANSNPMSVESFHPKQRKAWQGKCLVILKSSRDAGEAKLTVESDGLPKSEITLKVVDESKE
jgi:beta-galactosidase